jgi:peptidoglycan/LPS O-acetylase OafA/YrhL
MPAMTAPAANAAANRFEALDGWRGVCACLVVLFHFHGYSPLYTSALVRNSYLFVDFFFVLSGFVIAWNYADRLGTGADVRRFLVLRLGRVYPLHVFMLLCFVAYETAKLLMGLGQAAPPATFTGETHPGAVLSNLLLVQSLHLHDSLTWNGPSWSISTEAWTYLLFALACVSLGLRGWMLAVAAVVPPLWLLHVSGTGMDVTYDWGLVRCVFGFALGVGCAWFQRVRPAGLLHIGRHEATALELVMVAAVVLFVGAVGKTAWSLLAPFVFTVAVLVFASEQGAVSRLFRTAPMRWLGMLSYSIYLTHFFVVMLVPVAVKKLTHLDLWTPMPLPGGQYVQAYGRNDLEGTLFYAVVLALTLAFSAFTYRWIETPGRDWSRRLAGRAARPPAAPVKSDTKLSPRSAASPALCQSPHATCANSLNGPWVGTPSTGNADAELDSTPTARRA